MDAHSPRVFSIEHIGIMVDDPVALAGWYREVLGFDILLARGREDRGVAFVQPAGAGPRLEVAKLPDIAPTAATLSHHLQFHIALCSADPDADAAYLVERGARFIERCPQTMEGDALVVLADPWGNCLQLSRRGADNRRRLRLADPSPAAPR